MTEHIRPEFTPGTLPTFNGYHLQIFAAGRAKISLRTVTLKKKHEFYTALPKRDRDGLRRQKARSLKDLPEHYAAVDQLLSDHPDAKVFRIHAKGDNNATADNAHVLASLEQESLWLVMSGPTTCGSSSPKQQNGRYRCIPYWSNCWIRVCPPQAGSFHP